MVMGNASGRNDGEGTSGIDKYEEDYEQEEVMEFAAAQGGGAYAEVEPMVHTPSHSPVGYLRPPLMFSPQIPMVPLTRVGETTHAQSYALAHQLTDYGAVFNEKLRAVMITWSYDGKQVAVTGSWDNWEKREPLQKSGKDFIIVKMLPSGVYHYRFIVNENLRYAPDLPWEHDDSGTPYNILDVQDYVPEAPESLSEFESPPSPVSSYNNESLNDNDFSKLPPDMPPQLELTLLNQRSSTPEGQQSLPRPQPSVLNHLYIENNPGQPVALGSTHRFLQKYVTVVLYKPSRR